MRKKPETLAEAGADIAAACADLRRAIVKAAKDRLYSWEFRLRWWLSDRRK